MKTKTTEAAHFTLTYSENKKTTEAAHITLTYSENKKRIPNYQYPHIHVWIKMEQVE